MASLNKYYLVTYHPGGDRMVSLKTEMVTEMGLYSVAEKNTIIWSQEVDNKKYERWLRRKR